MFHSFFLFIIIKLKCFVLILLYLLKYFNFLFKLFSLSLQVMISILKLYYFWKAKCIFKFFSHFIYFSLQDLLSVNTFIFFLFHIYSEEKIKKILNIDLQSLFFFYSPTCSFYYYLRYDNLDSAYDSSYINC
jgi:hypothetical protein